MTGEDVPYSGKGASDWVMGYPRQEVSRDSVAPGGLLSDLRSLSLTERPEEPGSVPGSW